MTEHNAICLDIGDQVRMKMDPEARAWGQKGVPDDTIGYVIGYRWCTRYSSRWGLDLHSRPTPGVYESRCDVDVQWPDGTISGGGYSIEAVDKKKYDQRIAERVSAAALTDRTYYERNQKALCEIRIADLPETDFWEGDIIRVQRSAGREELAVITNIKYEYLYKWTSTNPPHPMHEHALYDIRYCDENGVDLHSGGTWAGTKGTELFKRGNLWRMYHNEPLVFSDLKNEIAFRLGLMQYDEVRNPASHLYSWTGKEALEAIRSGLADGFAMASGFFGMPAKPSLRRFHDRDLGERVRQTTIAGFEGVIDPDMRAA